MTSIAALALLSRGGGGGFGSTANSLNATFSLHEQFKHSSAVRVGDGPFLVKAEAKILH